MTTHRSSPLALTVLSLLHYKPLHPYGLQRLIKEWGKDLVVNVGQRASLYRTIERLQEAGLVAVRETERDQAYPERTVYEVTAEGRKVAREWLIEMLAEPKQEFPVFPAALSHLLMLAPEEIPDILERRLHAKTEQLAGLDAALAAGVGEAGEQPAGPAGERPGESGERAMAGGGLARAGLLEIEFLRAVTEAEVRWLRGVIADLREGRLVWSADELSAL